MTSLAAHRPSTPILVVESHDDTREIVQLFLTAAGFRVRTAAHCVEALQCAAEERPCLILLDILPIMHAVTFARNLRYGANPRLSATPIVLITAVDDAAHVQRQTGAVAIVRKPFIFDPLVALLERHCIYD